MVNYSTLTPELIELVGFRATPDLKLSDSLQVASSGLHVDSLSPVSLQLVSSIIPDEQATYTSEALTIGNWYEITDNSGGADFTTVGAISNDIGTLFEATGENPTYGDGSLNTLPVVDYLNLLRVDETNSIVRQWVSMLQNTLQIKDLKANEKLLQQVGTNNVAQNERARGYYIRLSKSNSLQLQLNSISLQLTEIDTVRFYLYEMGKAEAVFTFDYTSLAGDVSFQVLTNWLVNYQDSNGTGKEFLLLYYDYDSQNPQADIQLSETNEYIVSTRNCFNERYDLLRYVFFKPITIQKDKWNWNATTSQYDLPDFSNTTPMARCTSNENGVNLSMNITCDITNILIENKTLFAKMLQLAFAVRILKDCAGTFRENRERRITDEEARKRVNTYSADLYGDKWMGDNKQLQEMQGEIERVVNNFKNVDCECFKKDNKHSLTISNKYQNTKYYG